jgi:hypothetical protein
MVGDYGFKMVAHYTLVIKSLMGPDGYAFQVVQ